MVATLIYWHKARLQEGYVLEMEIHRVAKSSRYPDGVKYGLVLADLKTKHRVLMDNHHPKGPHIHLNNRELPYRYIDEERLIDDFKKLVLATMEVKL